MFEYYCSMFNTLLDILTVNRTMDAIQASATQVSTVYVDVVVVWIM